MPYKQDSSKLRSTGQCSCLNQATENQENDGFLALNSSWTGIKEDLRGTGHSVCQSSSGDGIQAEGCFSSIQLLFGSRHRFIQ